MAVGFVTRNSSPSRGMDVYGHSAVCPFLYTGPTAYATPGEAIAASAFKLGLVENIPDFIMINVAGSAVMAHYNVTTGRFRAFWPNGAGAPMVEVADGTDLSGYTGRSLAFGRG